MQRRTLLQVAAGVASLGQFGLDTASAAIVKSAATGAVGDFEFLSGNWKIKHRQWKNKQWDVFDGEATVFGMLGGAASVEELRIPARNFSGMGLRLLDIERKLWADYWVNGKRGVLNPPSWGSFTNGVGIWDAEDVDDGKPVITRGAWDQIAPDSCRWVQAVSRNNGKTWEENWLMNWLRV